MGKRTQSEKKWDEYQLRMVKHTCPVCGIFASEPRKVAHYLVYACECAGEDGRRAADADGRRVYYTYRSATAEDENA